MIRAGLIRKLGSGLYEWLPLGLKVLKKVENIVREEMDRAGACEVWLPRRPAQRAVGRKRAAGNTSATSCLKSKTAKGPSSALHRPPKKSSPIWPAKTCPSYKQLPFCLYQFGTKFRDEIRPRFGVMRAREFYMKDAYSFCATEEQASDWYQRMYDAYTRVFTRCGFKFKAVEADTGAIGGNFSHEFMVLADNGEDAIARLPRLRLRRQYGKG